LTGVYFFFSLQLLFGQYLNDFLFHQNTLAAPADLDTILAGNPASPVDFTKITNSQ
jgi:hypothetical protein